PADGATVTTLTPTLSATFADPDTQDTGKVTFQLCSNSSCASVLDTFDSTATSLAVGGAGSRAVPGGDIAADGTYWWRAKNTDASGAASSYSAIRSFVVDTTAPAFSSASVNGASLQLTLGETLDGAQAVTNAMFTVRKDGVVQTLTGTPSISTNRVTLTLAG